LSGVSSRRPIPGIPAAVHGSARVRALRGWARRPPRLDQHRDREPSGRPGFRRGRTLL